MVAGLSAADVSLQQILVSRMVAEAKEDEQPGLGVIFGPSGCGKTTALQAFQAAR